MKRTLLAVLAGITASLTTIHAPAQDLPVMTGLKLWLKADAGITAETSGEVTAWADQSGLGNNAAQTDTAKAPTIEANSLNGKPTVRFGGGTRFLDVATSPSISGLGSDVTVLVLVKYDDLSTYRGCLSRTTGHSPAPFDWWNNAGVNGGRTSFYLGDGNDPNNRGFVSTAAPRVGIYTVMGFSWGNGSVSQYLDDLPNGTGTYTITPADATPPAPPSVFRIGSRADFVTQLKGNLAEALVYQPALSDADRTAVINYLAQKWGVAFNKPPTVAIQTPAAGSTSPVGPLAVSIDAADSDGTIQRVDLLNNGELIASFSQAPYGLTLAMLNPGTAVFTAVATDNLGRTASAAPVTVTITGNVPAEPLKTGLKVWLKADAGMNADANNLVADWADQSGSLNNAVATDPGAAPLLVPNAINNKPALRFGPNNFTDNQYLEVSDEGTAFTTADFSTFVIAKFNNFGSYRTLWNKTFSGRAAPVDWWFAPSTGLPHTYRGNGDAFGGPIRGTRAPVAGQFAAVGLAVAGQNVSHYLGFSDNGDGTIANTPASMGMPLRIGRRDEGGTQMQGDIAEILIYDRALSAAERSNVVYYLCGKYGLAQAIIGNQPPVATVTSPANNASFAAGTSTPFTATASDSDGTIKSINLIANGAVIASLTNAPYQVSIEFLSPGPVTLTAIAVDNWDVPGTSAPVAITVTGTGPAAPPTADLRLWLRADDGPTTDGEGKITAWADKSGNANNAAQGYTAPLQVPNALNGKPVARFDGVDNFLEITTAPSIELAGDVTSFAVVKFEDFGGFRALWAKTSGNLPASVDYYLLPNTGVPRFYRGNGSALGAGFLDAGRAVAAGSYLVLGFDMAGSTASHYMNGQMVGSGQITAPLADGGKALRIGTRDDLATKFKGDLAELLVFGRALNESERVQLQAYLASKYGMALVRMINLPPTVTVTSPAGGSTVAAPGLMTMTAEVTDPDSTITQVEFLADGVPIATLTSAPYTIPLEVVSPGTLSLQARAVDFWGAATLSAPVTVTVTGTGPASPPTSGLALWLKADEGVATNLDGTVTTWADQSGNDNHATQAISSSAPVLIIDPATTRPALRFTDTAKYLDVASTPSVVIESDLSCFCRVKVDDFLEPGTIWSKTTAGLAYPWNYYVGGGRTVVVRGNTDGEAAVAGASRLQAGIPAAVGFTVEGALTTHYLNGQANGAGSMGFGALDQGSPLRIGLTDDQAMTNPFKGTMSEILLYARALSANEIQLATTYLAARSGISVVRMPAQPALTVTQVDPTNIRISWPAAFTGFVLEARTDIAAGTWADVATQNNQVTVGTTGVARFFRLRQQ